MNILIAVIFAFSVNAQIIPSDWSLEAYSTYNTKPKKEFESLGIYKLSTLDSALTPHGGFDSLYKRFQNEAPMTIRSGIWQEADAFRAWLASCELGLSVSTESLAIHMGLKSVFDSATEADALRVLEEIGGHLNTDQKIELAGLIGGVFVSNYDYGRAGGRKGGVVTFTELLKAAQTNTDAGVCRDMAQAQATALKAMGVDKCYVTTYQTRGGGHAVVLCQDPNNKDKTHSINYNYITKTTTSDPLGHFDANNTIPNTGIEVKIFDNAGKPLTSLPTNLGVLLYEMGGGNPKDLDPMMKSTNSIIGASLLSKKLTSISAGYGVSPDGDKVIAMTLSSKTGSTYAPSRVSITAYSNERMTDYHGKMSGQGIYLNAEQRLQTKNLVIKSAAGEFTFRPYLSAGVQFNVARTSFESSEDKRIGARGAYRASAGVEGSFTSRNGATKVSGNIEARADLIKSDVRDEGSRTLSPNTYVLDVGVEQKVSDRVSVLANGTVVSRKGLGMQSRQEVGVAVYGPKDTSVAVTVGHEGQIRGEAPVFIPGSRERYYADVTVAKKDKYRLSAGGFCDGSIKDCGVRATATVKLGPRKK